MNMKHFAVIGLLGFSTLAAYQPGPNATLVYSEAGAQVEKKADGSKFIKAADGTTVEVKADGTKIIKKPDGTTVEVKPAN
jgi:hypothetical protein